MNPSYWIPIGICICLGYLYYMLVIDFRLAKLDDDVAEPESDVHNDMEIWSYEYYLPRVKARQLRAFLRWVGVSAAVMLISSLLAGGGQRVKAMLLPTPTPSVTPTPSQAPTATRTPTAARTSTETPERVSYFSPTPTYEQFYKPGPAQVVIQTRVVTQNVSVPVQVTRLVTRIISATPAPTQTPRIIYLTAIPPSETVTVTPTALPSETASPTHSAVPPTETETATATETQQVNP